MKSILKINRWYFCIPFGLGIIPYEVFNIIFGGASLLIFLFWMYSISIQGQIMLKKKEFSSNNVNLFKIASFSIPIICLIQFLNERNLIFPQNMIILVLSIFLIIGCVLYIYYFTAKTITELELQRTVTPNEVYKNFWLLGLFIIGIIIIQPKLKKLLV